MPSHASAFPRPVPRRYTLSYPPSSNCPPSCFSASGIVPFVRRDRRTTRGCAGVQETRSPQSTRLRLHHHSGDDSQTSGFAGQFRTPSIHFYRLLVRRHSTNAQPNFARIPGGISWFQRLHKDHALAPIERVNALPVLKRVLLLCYSDQPK